MSQGGFTGPDISFYGNKLVVHVLVMVKACLVCKEIVNGDKSFYNFCTGNSSVHSANNWLIVLLKTG